MRRLVVTPEGAALLQQVMPAMTRAQQRILAPLPPAQKRRFLQLLTTLVTANNAASRAHSEAGEPGD
jgi:DNA-binding MarR family transcriptional regulator